MAPRDAGVSIAKVCLKRSRAGRSNRLVPLERVAQGNAREVEKLRVARLELRRAKEVPGMGMRVRTR